MTIQKVGLSLALATLLLLSSRAVAAPLPDYQFKSPSFNGQGYGTYVLTIENEEYTRQQAVQQALLAAQQQAKSDAANTPLNQDRKSTRLNSSHIPLSRMPSSA